MELRKIVRESLVKTINKQSNLTKRKSRLLSENIVENKTIINVDIQPEYEKFISFNLGDWANFINNSAPFNQIVFLYNGADTLGMINESSYKIWLNELGIDEEIISNSKFFDKGYAFFRYCMDSNISEDSIVNLVKFMIKYNINDSRDINAKFWKMFIKEHPDDDYGTGVLKDLLEDASDMINIPDLMEFLEPYSNIVLTGGGIKECLKEVEIALLSLDKQYKVLSQFTY